MMRDWGQIMMPNILHGFKITDPVSLNRRDLLAARIIATQISVCMKVFPAKVGRKNKKGECAAKRSHGDSRIFYYRERHK